MPENNGQAWRRWFGLLFLALSFGMLIWGQTVLKSHLTGASYIQYWAVCFLFTALAMLTALVDMWLVRRQSRRERRALLNRAFAERAGRDDPQQVSGEHESSKSNPT
jgi:hypothetical protein